MKKMIQFVSACVLLDYDYKILLSKRSQNKIFPGFWEFPGGKLKKSETPEIAIKRELKEELNIDTYEACLAPLTFTSFGYNNFHLVMFLFVCRKWKGVIQNKDSEKLIWVKKKDLRKFKMPPANISLISFIEDNI